VVDTATGPGEGRAYLPIGLALLITFVAVAAWARHAMGALPGDGIDRQLLATPDGLAWNAASAVSFVGSGPAVAVVGIAVGLWLAWQRRLRAAAVVIAAPAIAGIAELVAKSVVGRARPSTAVLSGESGLGFPSGHVTGFTALVVALLVVLVVEHHRRRKHVVVATALAAVLVVAMAAARVAVGAHFATDTVAGMLLGGATALLVAAATLPLERRLRG
jgi:membrane-associated phospholipid phosphatase